MPIKNRRKISNQIVYGKPDYKLTEIVFAKVRGHPDWPARVTSKTNDRYGVTFFGDNTTFEMAAEKLTKLGDYANNPFMQNHQRNSAFMAAWKETVIAIEFSKRYKPVSTSDSTFIDTVEKVSPKAETKIYPGGKNVTLEATYKITVENSSPIAATKIYLGKENTHTICLEVKPGRNKITVVSASRQAGEADIQHSEPMKTRLQTAISANLENNIK